MLLYKLVYNEHANCSYARGNAAGDPLPKVLNNVDEQRMENLLRRTSGILVHSGVEDQMVQSAVRHKLEQLQSQEGFPSFNQVQFQTAARQALRCNIARGLH